MSLLQNQRVRRPEHYWARLRLETPGLGGASKGDAHQRWEMQIKHLTPTLNTRGRTPVRPVPMRVSVVSDARKGSAALIEALRRQRHRGVPSAMPFLTLPLFAAMTVFTAWELGGLAVVSLLAPIAFYAGYAVQVSGRGERWAARRQHRIEVEMRRRLEDIDPTHSVFSLNYFEARLDQEIRRCKRHEIPLCVLTLHLTHGSDGWSAATSEFVRVAATLLRAEDSICHIGGSGYAVSLPHTTPAGAAVVISRLAQELRDEAPQFGLAYLPPGRAVSSQTLIEHALRTPVRPETAEVAASIEGRDGEVA